MPLKLLAIGDMHLGRRPSRLPPELAAESRSLGPVGAWERLLDQALAARVDVVLLAGDLVEREEDFFEAYRELDRGVRRLTSAGVRVLGIAGNHDVQVLPRLADQLEDFELVGAGGRWERWELTAGGETLSLHGWSFPSRQVQRSPLEGVRLERGPGYNLGLLHCDLEQPASPYGPVRRRELMDAGLDGWLLGHVHAPDPLSVERPMGYLGCISGMDPGEPGDHGPWLLTLEGGRLVALEHWVLAPLRWEPLTLDLTGLEEAEAARSLLLEQLRELDARLGGVREPPRAVGVRLRLGGASQLGEAVQSLFTRGDDPLLHEGRQGTLYFLERCRCETRPPLALESLARRSDPPGLLARRLLALQEPESEPARALIHAARERMTARQRESRWQLLEPEPPGDGEVAERLQQAGMRMLEALLSQQPDPGAGAGGTETRGESTP